jgi:hypothetical protein
MAPSASGPRHVPGYRTCAARLLTGPLLLSVLLLVDAGAQTAKTGIGSVTWLRASCSESLDTSVKKGGESIQTSMFHVWLSGFLQGMGGMASSGSEMSNIAKLPDLWRNDRLLCTDILRFLEVNRDAIPAHTSADNLLRAWYLMHHPNSTPDQKLFGEVCLIDICTTQADGTQSPFTEAQEKVVAKWLAQEKKGSASNPAPGKTSPKKKP